MINFGKGFGPTKEGEKLCLETMRILNLSTGPQL